MASSTVERFEMGVEDVVNQAKEALGGSDAAAEKVDQVAEVVKEKTPDQADSVIDAAASKAKDVLGG